MRNCMPTSSVNSLTNCKKKVPRVEFKNSSSIMLTTSKLVNKTGFVEVGRVITFDIPYERVHHRKKGGVGTS